MHASRVNRRTAFFTNSQGETFNAEMVRQAMLLKLQVNTVSAIESMQHRGIGPAIIQRVLSSLEMREDDKLAIAMFLHQR